MTSAQIQSLREWAESIDKTGTFENCWEAGDYQESLDDHNGDVERTRATLQACAEVWADRWADAQHHKDLS